ncbi:MAG: 3-hydroxybutyryl-CoA dehydrogenase [Chloroflexota bacterium]|jgi:3-hydroxybutyryl-CoA dehydrogenase|nr:3-hydroxybutyryl-CoA dehydrogenase [Chloroflexota bacterium]
MTRIASSPRPDDRYALTVGARILVCGAGLMGHGIAQTLAAAGRSVLVYEPESDRAAKGVERIAGNLRRSVDKGRLSEDERTDQLSRIAVADDLASAAAEVEGVVEAVFEDEGVKRALFSELDRSLKQGAFLASNTSSISITRLAEAVAPERRPRVVGMHFFSPVPVMPLVELIRGAETSDATEAEIRGIATDMGKQVIVSRDRPGFLVNRILIPFLAESMRLYEEGTGTAEDIDTGARVGLNHPMGPLELADFIGLDVCLGIMEVLRDGIGGEQFEPPSVLRDLVASGNLGQKTGRGFHAYPREKRA